MWLSPHDALQHADVQRKKKISGDLPALVRQRADEYEAFLTAHAGAFDLLHAHDSLSGSAAADAIAAGVAARLVRTAHHLDSFSDPELEARQARSILAADAVACVSGATASEVLARYGVCAAVVGNGVDRARFNSSGGELHLARRLGEKRPRILAVGGIEARKNTVRLLQAFATLRHDLPTAQLLVAGGVSLLNHEGYRREFESILAESSALRSAVSILGRVDDADMPALYRSADALAFPSLHEGFGLAVLEAMACGVPAVVSRNPPFTEYLDGESACWCDPQSAGSIAAALRRALEPDVARRCRRRGLEIATRHAWGQVAARQLAVYAQALTGRELCPR